MRHRPCNTHLYAKRTASIRYNGRATQMSPMTIWHKPVQCCVHNGHVAQLIRKLHTIFRSDHFGQ